MEDEMPEMDMFEEWWVTPQVWCNVKEMCRTAFWAGHNARGLVAEQSLKLTGPGGWRQRGICCLNALNSRRR